MHVARLGWILWLVVSSWAAVLTSCSGNHEPLDFDESDGGSDASVEEYDGGAGGGSSDSGGIDSGSGGCVTASDCDDGLSCTIDSCVSGVCSHVPGPNSGATACPAGQYCETGKGCVQGIVCASDGQCEAALGADGCKANIHCDPALALCRFSVLDNDGDGHGPIVCGGDDCNDADPTIFAGSTELCDGKDNDCNGIIDDGATCPGLAVCQGGQCVCPLPNRCGSDCVDKSQDRSHCGECNNACPAGVSCVDGRCLCPGSLKACSGACVDTAWAVDHCGACNARCADVPNGARACSVGSCRIGSCSPNFGDCNEQYGDGCEANLQTDARNCGYCGNACAANQSCTGGVCRLKDLRVLLVHAESASNQATDVQTKLQATGAFSVVDSFYAASDTPTVAKLQQYDSVLVWSNANFANTNLLGDNLATYFDGGGQVVVAVFAHGGVSSGLLGGRFGNPANGYILLAPADKDIDAASLGTVHEPESPLMAGVSQLSATGAYRSQGQVVNGGTVVARWSGTGRPLVVRGFVKGRNRVDLNMWPVSSAGSSNGWTGHGATLLKNALLYR